MNLVAGQQIAQCSYCGKSSFVHVPGRPDPPPPMQPPPVPFGHIYLQHDPTAHTRALDGAAKTMKWVFLLTGLGILVPAVIAVVATTSLTQSLGISRSPRAELATDDDDDAPTKSKRAAKEANKPKLALADLRRVELSSVLEQGLAIARKDDPRFQLTSAHAVNLRGGFVDLTGDGVVYMGFEFYALDPKLPPGKNAVGRRIAIRAEKPGVFEVSERSGPSRELDPRQNLPVPKCKSDAMWRAAVASGVAGESVAAVHLYNSNTYSGPNRFTWSLRVDGHDQYRRDIDVDNCTIVRDWSER
jgi:hypothetical protein